MSRIIIILTIFLLTACQLSAKEAKTVDGIVTYIHAADDLNFAVYNLQLDLCKTEKCVDELTAKLKVLVEASDYLNKLWCDLKPESEGCDSTR